MKVNITKQSIEIEADAESESQPGAFYKVKYGEYTNEWTCSCPDHQNRKHNCKHIDATRQQVGL